MAARPSRILQLAVSCTLLSSHYIPTPTFDKNPSALEDDGVLKAGPMFRRLIEGKEPVARDVFKAVESASDQPTCDPTHAARADA
jgi:hypothetical protein